VNSLFENSSPFSRELHLANFNILRLDILFPCPFISNRRCFIPCLQELCEFQIDETFRVPEVGTVVGGLLTKGVISEGAKLVIGKSSRETGCFIAALCTIMVYELRYC
jgi:hypothetical protein